MTRFTNTTLIALFTTLMVATTAMAQGTASAPSTVHIADNSGVAYFGGPLDLVNGPAPFPIDLDPTGAPWRKTIKSDPLTGFTGTGSFTMIETIQNVGTEPWYDWHEDLLNNGQLGVVWDAVTQVTVNGNPITFNEVLVGNSLSIDTFSQPVLPGDIFVIEKDLRTTSKVIAPDTTLFQVLEYPTPEPASAALLGIGSIVLMGKRRLSQRTA